ncbi:hypothetical protein GQ56_0138930 [Burkholderia paludis]|nr:hypothetical protein GQ56_0138930 [Burkholderia paludis]
MAKPMTRALRRHHFERIKRARKFYLVLGKRRENPVELGRFVTTPAPCSCWMCGNPRRHLGELTMQERRMFQDVDDE